MAQFFKVLTLATGVQLRITTGDMGGGARRIAAKTVIEAKHMELARWRMYEISRYSAGSRIASMFGTGRHPEA